MMRSHGWDRDLPKDAQTKLRKEFGGNDFDSLYNFYVPGLNVRSTDLQAFIGLRAIDKLDEYSYKRRVNFHQYKSQIKNNILKLKENKNDFVSSFAIPILNINRDKIAQELQDNNIEVRPLIAGNMATKPMWYNENKIPSLPNCELVNKIGFYIPNHQDLTKEEINQITTIINRYE
jgi:CDP-6-deoxy-D-xylo-4-hexulose-3-dehydrase